MVDIRDRRIGPIVVIDLDGRMVANDQPGMVKEAVAKALADGATDVLIDVAGVNYMDSTRLGELIGVHVTVSCRGGRMGLVRVGPRVLELLRLTGLTQVIPVFSSLEDGLTHFR